MPASIVESYEETLFGFWEWDMTNRSEFLNADIKSFLGYGADEFPDSWEFWKLVINPADWLLIKKHFLRYNKSTFIKPFVQHIRLLHKNGAVVHILIVGKIKVSEGGQQSPKMEGSYVNVTRQKQAETELVRIKDFLNRTNHAARVGGWELLVKEKLLFWTEISYSIFEADHLSVPYLASFLDFFKEKKLLYDAIESQQPFNLELEATTAKGKQIWVHCIGEPFYVNAECIRLSGSVQDITELKIAKERLRLHEEQLASFIQQLPVAIAIVDSNRKYIAASNIWKAHFSLQDMDVAGKSHYDLFPGTSDIWKHYHKRGMAGEDLKMDEDSFIGLQGRTEWMQWEIRPWYEVSGKVGGIIVFGAVISERHAFNESILQAMMSAQESSLIKSEFLSVMSHEMRTPLNAVIGFINLLLQDPREDQEEKMSVLKFSAENLLVLINNILDYNKLDADKVKLDQTDFNLMDLLQNIVTSMQHEADMKKIGLELHIGSGLPAYLISDSARLGQILINLVSNAIKFTPSGKVSVTVKMISQDDSTATISFEIADTGIGIPSDKHQQVFEMFAQADANTTRKYGGTGLGLTISKKLLKIMRSQIRLVSEPGKGSTFSFDVVFQKSNKEYESVRNPFTIQDADLHGTKILIVDDHPINILVLRKFLEQWHCLCSVAENGLIAVDMVTNNDYDLILMDLQMPVLDGYEAAITIRKLPAEKYRLLPIIAITASAVVTRKDRIFSSGMNGVIGKPFVPEQLFKLIASNLLART